MTSSALRPQVVKKQEHKLSLIRAQLEEALATDKDTMSSTLIVEGEMMSFEIEELKIRLRERELEVRCRPSPPTVVPFLHARKKRLVTRTRSRTPRILWCGGAAET